MPAISLLLLFSALLGWNLLGIRATGSRYYGPLWSLCVLTVAIYLFALFGMLQPVTLALVGAGIAYLIYLVVSKQLATVRDYRPFLIAAPSFSYSHGCIPEGWLLLVELVSDLHRHICQRWLGDEPSD